MYKTKNVWKYPRPEYGDFGDNKSVLEGFGKTLIDKFISENQKKEKKLKEEEYYRFKRSKPTPFIVKWKSSLNQKEFFSILKADDKHHFKTLKRDHISVPFKRTKIDGDFFEKQVKVI